MIENIVFNEMTITVKLRLIVSFQLNVYFVTKQSMFCYHGDLN